MSKAAETLKAIGKKHHNEFDDVIFECEGKCLVSGSPDGHNSWIFSDNSILIMDEFSGEFQVV